MANKEKKEKEDTPLIKQYYKFKAACPEALLLMRVGDFYETYGEDAVTTSKVLGIVQTRKSNGDQGYIEAISSWRGFRTIRFRATCPSW